MKILNELKDFDNIEEAEFTLLEDLKITDEDLKITDEDLKITDEDLKVKKEENFYPQNLNILTHIFNRVYLNKIIKIKGNKLFLRNYNGYEKKFDYKGYFEIAEINEEHISKFKEGDIILIDDNTFDIKIIDKDFLKNFSCSEEDKAEYSILEIKNFKEDIITQKTFDIALKEYRKEQELRIKNQKQEEEKRKERELKEQKKREKEKEQRLKNGNLTIEENYEINNIFDDKSVKVENNIIINNLNNTKIIFNDKINKLIPFNILRTENYFYTNTSPTEHHAIKNEISYELKDINGNVRYKVEFIKDKKPKINGVEVNKSRMDFILTRIKPTTTDEEIKQFNSFSQMKIDFINLKSLKISKHKLSIDISVEVINKENFKLNFMGKDKNLSWNEVKKYFFYGGNTRSIMTYVRNQQFFELVKFYDIPKQEYFNYLKKIKMLNSLKNENED